MDQFGYFVIGSGIYIGTGPDFIAVFVIENDPLAHTGSGNSADFSRIDPCFCDYIPDAASGQIPVMYPIEVHAAGISGILSVFPLLLGTSQLVSFQVKEDSADAAGSGVDRH